MDLACSLRIFGTMARLQDSCRKARRAGFHTIELDWTRICREFPDRARRVTVVKEVLTDNQLTVAGACAGEITAERPDQLRLQIRDMTSVFEDIKSVGVKLGVLVGGPRTLENFNCFREGLLESLAPEAERCGLTLAVANQMETRIQTRQDLLALFSGSLPPQIGACIDVHQFQLTATNAGDAIREMGTRVKLVRMSDLMGTLTVPLGFGEIDIKGLVRTLRKVGYDGAVVVDHLPVRDEKIERVLEDAYGYMQGIIT